ncbi:MAG: hypothetical protein ACXVCP_16380 [Bdellovibrio sp.]
MKHKSLRLGFDVTLEKGTTLKPLKVQFWSNEENYNKFKPTEPFKYMADALTGLSLIKLNHYIKSPVATPKMDYAFACDSWKALDPHIELYDRSQPRVRALQSHIAVVNPSICAEFENHFNEQFETVIKPWGVDLTALWPLLDNLTWLETKMNTPLLYNFGVNFSKPFMDKLHTLFSFLYHLRSLVAIDHNAHIEDQSHDGVKVDALTDYLPRAEYIVNDSLLYWNFKKLSQPFSGPKAPDSRVENLLVNPLEKIFQKFSHNACHLINNLPKTFLASLNPIELEEALHLVQMDWLLGSPAGLLFKIREEIFALQSGYEKIFWKDAEPNFHDKQVALHLCCELKESEIFGKTSA